MHCRLLSFIANACLWCIHTFELQLLKCKFIISWNWCPLCCTKLAIPSSKKLAFVICLDCHLLRLISFSPLFWGVGGAHETHHLLFEEPFSYSLVLSVICRNLRACILSAIWLNSVHPYPYMDIPYSLWLFPVNIECELLIWSYLILSEMIPICHVTVYCLC